MMYYMITIMFSVFICINLMFPTLNDNWLYVSYCYICIYVFYISSLLYRFIHNNRTAMKKSLIIFPLLRIHLLMWPQDIISVAGETQLCAKSCCCSKGGGGILAASCNVIWLLWSITQLYICICGGSGGALNSDCICVFWYSLIYNREPIHSMYPSYPFSSNISGC